MQELFTVKDISRLFGLSESRVRYWAQTGFISPSEQKGGRRFYTFVDLISFRVAKSLLDSGMSLQRVRKNLRTLQQILPDVQQPLSRLRVKSDGDRMWVDGEEASFDAHSGQLLISFDTGELHDDVVRILDLGRPVGKRVSPAPDPTKGGREAAPHRTAYRWFLEGLSQDESSDSRDQAMDAYRRALELDPSLAAAHTNLGILYYLKDDRDKARRQFERALSLDPEQPEARFNLANLYEQDGQRELAIAEFRRVVASAPAFADAHFNLGLALEKVGSRVQAAEHFRRYLELDQEPGGVWSRMARGHLDFLEG